MTERLADVVGQVEEAVPAAACEPGAADRLASLRMLISMRLRVSPAAPSEALIFSAEDSRTNHSGADVLRADDLGADLSGAGSAGAGPSVAGSFAAGSAVAGRSGAVHYPAKSSETGAEVAARVRGRHHPLTVVMTAAARPEDDDLARAAAQAALVLDAGHSVTRMLDKRLRSCRRTGPNTPHPPTAPPTPSGPTPLP